MNERDIKLTEHVEVGQPEHAYPNSLARLVERRWAHAGVGTVGLPGPEVLRRFLSVSYQASLLHEEGRPVTFRVALAGPDTFDVAAGPPAGLHRLVLSQVRPFDEHEVRRLAPAADFQRSLIGVAVDADSTLSVWGMLHSGPRWLQAMRGGRRIKQIIPPVLMAAVTGPGRVLVSRGTQTLAALAGGTLVDCAVDVFAAPWFAAVFEDNGAGPLQWRGLTDEENVALHEVLTPNIWRKLAEHALRRIVATIRGTRHGGTLVILPAGSAEALIQEGPAIVVKYPIRDEEPRRRLLSLMAKIMTQLAELSFRGPSGAQRLASWADYEASADPYLAELDESFFEGAHTIATLANVDGAIVMTNQFEILGFGAEISSALPDVEFVDRSLDIEANERVAERTDRVGTRHRSSYRLCQHLREALVVVVSQDGGVRFVRWHDRSVTYFDQVATGPWEV